MTQDLATVLEELLADAPGTDAFHLRIRDDFAEVEVSDSDLDATFAEFEGILKEAVASISRTWGPPTFDGAVDQDDFPAWSEALVLAYWQRENGIGFVALRHDDDHEPMFVEVGALTDDEVATLLYTKS